MIDLASARCWAVGTRRWRCARDARERASKRCGLQTATQGSTSPVPRSSKARIAAYRDLSAGSSSTKMPACSGASVPTVAPGLRVSVPWTRSVPERGQKCRYSPDATCSLEPGDAAVLAGASASNDTPSGRAGLVGLQRGRVSSEAKASLVSDALPRLPKALPAASGRSR